MVKYMETSVDELVKIFTDKDEAKLNRVRIILWINIIGPRTSNRELIVYSIDEELSMLGLMGFKLEVDGLLFIKNLFAFEVSKDYFVLKDIATEFHWKTFLEQVIKKKLPKVLFHENFRRSLGLPDDIVNFDLYTIGIHITE